jgi:hypothetical protein
MFQHRPQPVQPRQQTQPQQQQRPQPTQPRQQTQSQPQQPLRPAFSQAFADFAASISSASRNSENGGTVPKLSLGGGGGGGGSGSGSGAGSPRQQQSYLTPQQPGNKLITFETVFTTSLI